MKRKDYYNATKIKENVYRITSVEGVFCELLVGEDKAMLIDTTNGLGDLASTVRAITDKPLIIVNTHGHVDHTSGNCQFVEPAYISPEDMELCRKHNSRKQREFTIKDYSYKQNYMTGEYFCGLPDDFDKEKYLGENEGELLPLDEGKVFDLGGITIETIKTPGHTKGGMSFYYKEENWLYSGDAFGFFLWLFDNDSTDRKTYLKGLEKVIALKPDRIYGGHNPMPMNVSDLELYRRTAIEAKFENGQPFEAPILEVEGKLPEIRVCPIDGMTMADFGKPGFAAIVIKKGI